MKKLSLFIGLAVVLLNSLQAQISLTAIGTPTTDDFQSFQANGCSPTPAAGQLDSRNYAIFGFTTGPTGSTVPNDLPFNDTAFVGDLARGYRKVGIPVTVAGLYCYWDTITGEKLSWIQATGNDFTPGEVWMRVQNNTGAAIGGVDFSYDLTYLNDAPRGQSISLSYSIDSLNFFPLENYLTDSTADATLYTMPGMVSVTGLNLADGDRIFFRWTSDDSTGAGARDEFGWDNLSFTPTPLPVLPTVSIGFTAQTLAESAGVYGFYINESGTLGPCTVDVVFSGTAIATTDYNILGATTISLDAANPSVLSGVDIIDDLLPETSEDIIIMLQNPVGCTLGTPTTAVITITDNDSQPTSDVEFALSTTTESETSGMAMIDITQTTALPCSVEVAIQGGTATSPADFTFASPTTIIFDGITPTQTLMIPIIDDALVEGLENVDFILQNISGAGCSLTVNNFHNLVIQDNDLPLYPIGDVTTVDAATGVVDSLDVVCRLRGIVHGVNLRASTNGLQFVVKDSTGTIWTFQGIKNFGYTVTEGDLIEMKGAIKQFNGITQIALDTVILINSGLPLMNTIPVTSFLEANEADLVGLNMFKLVDPAQWTGMGASGFNVRITNNVDTFTVRIDNDVDLYALPAPPCEWFNIRGLLGQFDNSNPYTTGYQLFPRYVQDINCIPAPAMSFTMMTSSVLENIPTTNVTVGITNPNPDPTIATIALSGTATNTSDYTLASTTVTFPPNSTTNVTIPVSIVNDALTEGDETIVLTLTNPTNGAQIGTAAHTITIMDDDGISITPALHPSTITLFPNPGTESFTVKSSEHVNTVIVFDINGKECFRTSHTLSPISMGHLARGMYLIQAITDKGNWNGKWIKE